jgi:hypothetical protein
MVKKAPKKTKTTKQPQPNRRRVYPIIAVAILAVVLLIVVIRPSVLPGWLPFVGGNSQSITNPDAPLAEFYAPEVLRWRSQIEEWAKAYDVNPNVIAIVMQIESCGDPTAISGAGAMGLMQVMPFHFDNGENMINPDTNVENGMTVFYECLTQFADWDLGLALACYNGGPSVTTRDFSTWAQETQSYYRWATGMWNDVKNGEKTSDTLSEWMEAGGSRLCVAATAG